MADKKISQLTGATTPLDGTEVLPVVQSGSTVKVAVSDLTNGREVAATSVIVGNARTRLASSYIADVPGPTGNNTGILFGGNTIFPCDGDGSLTNGVASLGSSSYKWYDIHLENNVVIGTAGKGIDFSADAHAAGMTSELLDDYEEGTWTPTDASGAGLTLTVTNATYVKIGRQVFANFAITYPSTADASTIRVGGLPFTSSSTGFSHPMVVSTCQTGVCKNGLVDTSATTFLLIDTTGNALTNVQMSDLFLRGTVIYEV